MVRKEGLKAADALVIAVLVFSAAVYYLSYYDCGLNLLDEGYLLDPVQRVFNGEVPYRDFHHFYAPASFYFFAGLFKLTGRPDILTVRIAWVFIHILAGIFVYLSARKISSRVFALAAASIILLAPGVWHKGFFVFFVVFLIWAAFEYFDKRSALRAFLFGVCSGAAFSFRQDVGVYAVVAFIAVMVWLRIAEKDRGALRDIGWFAAGGAAILLPFAIYFAAEGALKPLALDIFLAGEKGTNANNLPFPSIFSPGNANGFFTALFFYIPFIAYGWGAITLILSGNDERGRRDNHKLLFLVVFGLLVCLQIKNRTDMAHLWQVMPPVVITVAGLLYRLQRKLADSGYVRASAYILLGIFVVWSGFVALGSPASGSIKLGDGNDFPLDEPRARVFIPKSNAKDLKDTLDYLMHHASGDAGVLVVPDAPMLYFLLDKKNPVDYELFRLGMTSRRETQLSIIRQLENKKVGYVVVNMQEVDDGRPERRFASHSKILYDYIYSKYSLSVNFGQFQVFGLVK